MKVLFHWHSMFVCLSFFYILGVNESFLVVCVCLNVSVHICAHHLCCLDSSCCPLQVCDRHPHWGSANRRVITNHWYSQSIYSLTSVVSRFNRSVVCVSTCGLWKLPHGQRELVLTSRGRSSQQSRHHVANLHHRLVRTCGHVTGCVGRRAMQTLRTVRGSWRTGDRWRCTPSREGELVNFTTNKKP